MYIFLNVNLNKFHYFKQKMSTNSSVEHLYIYV